MLLTQQVVLARNTQNLDPSNQMHGVTAFGVGPAKAGQLREIEEVFIEAA